MARALSIFTGHTLHKRSKPFQHGFRYRLAFIRIDLRRLREAGRASRLFSVGRFNLFSFHPRDHGGRDGGNLEAWARGRLTEAGADLSGDIQLTLLCQPRVLGYQFNPISVFEARDTEGRLRGAIYEVHNTFNDVHAYVAAFGEDGPASHAANKRFHVSPFFDMSGRYRFELNSADDDFRLAITKSHAEGPDFLATMVLKGRPATTAGFMGLFASQPFSTLKTIAGIHFEALRIWMKGGRYHSRPDPPVPPVTRIHLGSRHVSS